MPTPTRITAAGVRRDLAAYIRHRLSLPEDMPLPNDLQYLIDSTAEGIAEITNYVNAHSPVPTETQEHIIAAVKAFEQKADN